MHDLKGKARYIGTKYSVKIDPLYVEWDKLIPTLEEHFPDILDEILNCDHQRYASVHNQDQSTPASNSKLNTNFRCGFTDGGQRQRPPSSTFLQPKPRG